MSSRDYDLQAQLGKGSQGVVWRAKRKADSVHVAIKQIMLRSMSRREQADAAQEVTRTLYMMVVSLSFSPLVSVWLQMCAVIRCHF